MANFVNKSVTNAGAAIISKVMAGADTFNFTRIALGSGTIPANDIVTATALADEQMSLAISSMAYKDNRCDFNALLLGSNVTASFTWTEVGLFGEDSAGNEILYFYGLNNDVDTISNGISQKIIQVVTYLASNANITATIAPTFQVPRLELVSESRSVGIYDGQSDSVIDITPSKIGAQEQLDKVKSIELGASTGVNAQDTYIDFHSDNANYNDYSARIIAPSGTNNLEVATGNSAGTVNIDGKLTVKDKSVFDESSVIPVANGGTGLSQVSAGALVVGNDKNALTILNGTGALFALSRGVPQFGTLPISAGGTGVSSFTAGSVLLGNGAGTFQQLMGIGALYAGTSGSPQFGTLPVSAGGTGKAKITKGALVAGNDTGAAQEVIGTGALYASTSGTPQFGTLPVSMGGTGRTTYSKGAIAYAYAKDAMGQILPPTTEEGILYCDVSSTPKYITMDELAELLKDKIGGGDIVGKKMAQENIVIQAYYSTYTLAKNYTNPKGGMIRMVDPHGSGSHLIFKIVVDGEIIVNDVFAASLMGAGEGNLCAGFADIPFKESIQIYLRNNAASSSTVNPTPATTRLSLLYYLNQ